MSRSALAAALLLVVAVSVFAGAITREKAGLAPPAGPAPGGPVGEMQVLTRKTGTTLQFRFVGLVPYATYEVKGNDGELFLGRFTPNGAGKAKLKVATSAGNTPDLGWLTGRTVVLTHHLSDSVLLVGVFPGERTTLGDPPPPGPDPDPGPWPPAPPPPPPPPPPDPKPETRLAGVDGDGPYPVASETVSLPTASGGLNPNSSVVWWPGTSGCLYGTTEMYPPIALIHGFSLRATNYGEYAAKLASWGFVVLVGDHQDPLFFPDHEKEIRTALGYVDWLVARNADASSRFFGRLSTDRVGLFGHSLGGGVSVVAATRSAGGGRIKACAGIAPAALSGPSGAISPDTSTGLWPPTLVISGSEDTIVPPATSRNAYYSPAPKPRQFLRIDGHCHTNYSDTVALAIDYNASTCVSSEVQRKKTRLYLVSWFLYHLKGDTRVLDYVDGTYAAEDASVEELLSDS